MKKIILALIAILVFGKMLPLMLVVLIIVTPVLIIKEAME